RGVLAAPAAELRELQLGEAAREPLRGAIVALRALPALERDVAALTLLLLGHVAPSSFAAPSRGRVICRASWRSPFVLLPSHTNLGPALRASPRSGGGSSLRGAPPERAARHAAYSRIFTTVPAPTVLPPSRMAKRRFSSMAIGVISSTSTSTWSPGMHISAPPRSLVVPVTSVVRK